MDMCISLYILCTYLSSQKQTNFSNIFQNVPIENVSSWVKWNYLKKCIVLNLQIGEDDSGAYQTLRVCLILDPSFRQSKCTIKPIKKYVHTFVAKFVFCQ